MDTAAIAPMPAPPVAAPPVPVPAVPVGGVAPPVPPVPVPVTPITNALPGLPLLPSSLPMPTDLVCEGTAWSADRTSRGGERTVTALPVTGRDRW